MVCHSGWQVYSRFKYLVLGYLFDGMSLISSSGSEHGLLEEAVLTLNGKGRLFGGCFFFFPHEECHYPYSFFAKRKDQAEIGYESNWML